MGQERRFENGPANSGSPLDTGRVAARQRTTTSGQSRNWPRGKRRNPFRAVLLSSVFPTVSVYGVMTAADTGTEDTVAAPSSCAFHDVI